MTDDLFRKIPLDNVTINEDPVTPADSQVQQNPISIPGIVSEPDSLEGPAPLQSFSEEILRGNADVADLMKLSTDVGANEPSADVANISFKNSRMWKTDGASLEWGEVKWDTIAFLKSNMWRNDGSANDMMAALLRLNDDDLAVTLKTLAESGTPSDLSIIMKRFALYGFKEQMGELLAKLGMSLPAEALQETFQQMLTSVYDNEVLIDFLQQASGKGTLPNLNRENLLLIFDKLMSPPTISGNLFAIALLKETGIEPDHDPKVLWGIPDPKYLLDSLLSGKTSDPNLAKALAAFPDWALNSLKDLDQTKTYLLVSKMLYPMTQDLGPFLAELCKRPESSSKVLLNILRSFQEPKLLGSAAPYSTAWVTDAQIRSMISSLGDDAVKVLSQLSPLRLLEMKSILEAGDETRENQAVVQKIIQPAYDEATKP